MGLNSNVAHMFDAAAAVTLRDITDGAETSTASETGVSLNVNQTAYWSQQEVPDETFSVVFHVTAMDETTGDETYVFSIDVDSELAFGDSPVTVWTGPELRASDFPTPGVFVANLDADSMKAVDADLSHIRVTATLAGTTPSITYGAWIAPAL